MKKIIILMVLILMGFVGAAYGQEGPVPEKKTKRYVCLAEQSAGFQYDEDKKKWVATIFRTDEKYIIRGAKQEDFKDMVDIFPGLKDFKNANYIVQEFGSQMVSYYCLGPYLKGIFFARDISDLFGLITSPYGFRAAMIQAMSFLVANLEPALSGKIPPLCRLAPVAPFNRGCLRGHPEVTRI